MQTQARKRQAPQACRPTGHETDNFISSSITKSTGSFNVEIKTKGYRLPNIFDTAEDHRRFHNLDLVDMSAFALWQERNRVRAALTWADRDERIPTTSGFTGALSWLVGRLEAIVDEENRRKTRIN